MTLKQKIKRAMVAFGGFIGGLVSLTFSLFAIKSTAVKTKQQCVAIKARIDNGASHQDVKVDAAKAVISIGETGMALAAFATTAQPTYAAGNAIGTELTEQAVEFADTVLSQIATTAQQSLFFAFTKFSSEVVEDLNNTLSAAVEDPNDDSNDFLSCIDEDEEDPEIQALIAEETGSESTDISNDTEATIKSAGLIFSNALTNVMHSFADQLVAAAVNSFRSAPRQQA